MTTREPPWAMVAVALVLVGAGAVFFVMTGSSDESDQAGPTPASSRTPSTSAASSASADSPPVPAVRKPKPKLDSETSARKRSQIQQALADRSGSPASRSADPAGAPANDDEDSEPPALDAEYIRARIKEDLLPVAIECYESALADDPKLAGKLVMNFTILGDPEVGGVVDEAAVDADQSTLANEFVRECMRESLMAISFDAPPEGGQVEVTYPFEFASEAPE